MELAQILVQLWRRRLAVAAVAVFAAFVALALAYQISVFPPGLRTARSRTARAETHILVDSPRSSVADLNRSFDPLVARAQVFSELMTTAPVVDRIAKIAGVPASAITATSDNSTLNVPTSRGRADGQRPLERHHRRGPPLPDHVPRRARAADGDGLRPGADRRRGDQDRQRRRQGRGRVGQGHPGPPARPRQPPHAAHAARRRDRRDGEQRREPDRRRARVRRDPRRRLAC